MTKEKEKKVRSPYRAFQATFESVDAEDNTTISIVLIVSTSLKRASSHAETLTLPDGKYEGQSLTSVVTKPEIEVA